MGNRKIILWLFSGCFLIFTMVIVGGITRLTGSGLSITEWKLVRGTIPPVNEDQWNAEFENYKQIPQYREMNYNYTLSDFKKIYFWEYIHRLIGRVIGIVFIIPFLYFLFTKQILINFNKPFAYFLIGIIQVIFFNVYTNIPETLRSFSNIIFYILLIQYIYFALKSKILFHQLILLLIFGGLQGFLGWYMVKSGLVNNIRVSHLRLALHLITAFITFGFTFWVMLGIVPQKKTIENSLTITLRKASYIILGLIIVQIIYGAFVAGLKAGHIYNTFPKMGDEWVASSVSYGIQADGISSMLNNISVVQFVHRSFAWVLSLLIIFLWYYAKTKNNISGRLLLSSEQIAAINFLVMGILLQFILGVFTLVCNVPITLGVLHQAGAFLLFTIAIYSLYLFRTNPSHSA